MQKSGKEPFDVMKLFENKDMVKICAPMVRYSKLQFRNLVKHYNCDLCYTPMILADSFCKSGKARNNEFTTNLYDSPVITQFAANTVHDFVGAACMVSPYCNGVDLNCGCPQRWARQLGLGCSLMEKPELVSDLVRQCRNRILKPFTVSVKMRLKKDLKKTVDLCQQLEKSGVSYLTIHGRTSDQQTGQINVEALRLLKESVQVPVVANGGLKTLQECLDLHEATNCQGVMVANGLLTNPTLFTGTNETTLDCIQKWLNICYNTTATSEEIHTIPEKPPNLTFQCFHHHLVFMLEKILTRAEKRVFNNLQSFEDVLSFVRDKFGLVPQLDDFNLLKLLDLDYDGRDDVYFRLKPDNKTVMGCDFLYDYSKDGNYFNSKVQEECDWSDLFLENG